jgi:hypothetical protein
MRVGNSFNPIKVRHELSAHGTKRTFAALQNLSAFGPKRTKIDFGRGWFVR